MRAQRRDALHKAIQASGLWGSSSPARCPDQPCPTLPQCAYLQAKNCQVESKYLAGLRRLQEAMGNEASECAELLRQLIQEALQWEASDASADGVELSPIR